MKRVTTVLLLGIALVSGIVAQDASYFDRKLAAIEKVLGQTDEYVLHAIIPFDAGGTLDLYPITLKDGTAFFSMELYDENTSFDVNADGDFELVMFVRDRKGSGTFSKKSATVDQILTTIAWAAHEETYNDLDTAEIPTDTGAKICLLLTILPSNGELNFDGKRHNLMLAIQVFESEMNYAMDNGTENMIELLVKNKVFPYSDLARKPLK